MAFQCIGFIKIPKFIGNFYIANDIPVYQGVANTNDSDYYNYYLNGVGWVIANTFFPFKLSSTGQSSLSVRYKDVNGYCYYVGHSDTYFYTRGIYRYVVRYPAYIGCLPIGYTYGNPEGADYHYGGDDYYYSSNDINLSNSTSLWAAGSNNPYSGNSITVKLSLQNCYVKSGNSYSSRYGVYTHNSSGAIKALGCPRWQGLNDGYYVKSATKKQNNRFVYRHTTDEKLNIYYSGSKWTIQSGKWNLSGQPTANQPIVLTGQSSQTLAFVDYVAGNQTIQAYAAEVARWI